MLYRKFGYIAILSAALFLMFIADAYVVKSHDGQLSEEEIEKLEYSFDGEYSDRVDGEYRDIYIQSTIGDRERIIKLYTEEDEAYFFMPSCKQESMPSSMPSDNDSILCFDDSIYSISIDGKEFGNGTPLLPYYGKTSDLCIKDIKSNDVKNYSLQILFSENLPSFFLDTSDGTMEYLNANKTNSRVAKAECINSDGSVDLSSNISDVHARGNFSFFKVNAKSYKIIFNEKTDVLGMGAAKEWCLVSNIFDYTKQRNTIFLNLAELLGVHDAVKSRAIDVYFNGEYGGSYLCVEAISIKDDQAKVGNENDLMLFSTTADKRITDKYCFKADSGRYFQIEKYKNISDKDFIKFQAAVNSLEEYIANYDEDAALDELYKRIDVDGLASMYLVDYISNNQDSGRFSTYYIYNKKTGYFELGPAWDFDKTVGCTSNIYSYDNFNNFIEGWPQQLMKNKYFRQLVIDKYETVVKIYTESLLEGGIDQLGQQLLASVTMDRIIHGNEQTKTIGFDCYEDDLSYLKYYLQKRKDLTEAVLYNPEQFKTIYFADEKKGCRKYWYKEGEQLKRGFIDNCLKYYGKDYFVHENERPYLYGDDLFDGETLISLGYEEGYVPRDLISVDSDSYKEYLEYPDNTSDNDSICSVTILDNDNPVTLYFKQGECISQDAIDALCEEFNCNYLTLKNGCIWWDDIPVLTDIKLYPYGDISK